MVPTGALVQLRPVPDTIGKVSWKVVRRICTVAAGVAAIDGCYVYAPAPTTPATGSDLVLELNDRGRSGLSDSIGMGATMIEGKTAATSDSAYSLLVSRVNYLSRQSNSWSGERLVVPRLFVSNAQQRTFSKSRTGVVAALVSAAVVSFVASRGLLGFGSTATVPPGGGPPGQN